MTYSFSIQNQADSAPVQSSFILLHVKAPVGIRRNDGRWFDFGLITVLFRLC